MPFATPELKLPLQARFRPPRRNIDDAAVIIVVMPRRHDAPDADGLSLQAVDDFRFRKGLAEACFDDDVASCWRDFGHEAGIDRHDIQLAIFLTPRAMQAA